MKLPEIGLRKNEEKVYETLLLLGKSSASQISKESQVPYGRIYSVLDSLEEKGLVMIVPEKTKHYVPSNPEKLASFITAKRAAIDLFEKKVASYKTIYQNHDLEAVQIVRGRNGFYKLLREMKRSQTYEYNFKSTFDVYPEILRDAEILVKQGVDFKTLGPVSLVPPENLIEWKKITQNIRSFDSKDVALSIVDDNELMLTLIKSNVTLLFRDKPFVLLMKRLFLAAYKEAPLIPKK